MNVPLYLQCTMSLSPLNSLLTNLDATEVAVLKVNKELSGRSLLKLESIVRTCQNLEKFFLLLHVG